MYQGFRGLIVRCVWLGIILLWDGQFGYLVLFYLQATLMKKENQKKK
jgi:hypothetical protein